MLTNDFSVWSNGVALIAPGGDGEFGIWSNGIPLVIQDESSGTAGNIAGLIRISTRTRASITTTRRMSGRVQITFGSSAKIKGIRGRRRAMIM
jgi:hypothetical protein